MRPVFAAVLTLLFSMMVWDGAVSVNLLPLHPSCANGYLSMTMGKQFVEVSNMTARVFGLDPSNNQPYRGASAQCRVLDVTERNSPESYCKYTLDEYIPDFDELHIQSLMNSTEVRCEYYETEGELEPGVSGKTLGINVTRLDLPETYLLLKFMNPYQDYTFISNDTRFTTNETYSRVYVKNRLKITIAQSNFNWTPPLNPIDAHYLKLYVECEFVVEQDFVMTIRKNVVEKWTTLEAGNVEMNIRFEQGVEVDGVPYIAGTEETTYQLGGEGPASFGLYGTKTVCWDRVVLTRYSSIVWDPSMQVLFTPPKSSNKKWVVPVAVTLSIVIVLVLVVIALAIFVPSFRHWVRPYSARSDKKAASNESLQRLQTYTDNSTSSESETGWQAGTKPNSLL